jgi:hypothetical protein
VVTPDYSGSSGQILFAYARTAACNSGEIGVLTKRRTPAGSISNSDLVGFTLIAP